MRTSGGVGAGRESMSHPENCGNASTATTRRSTSRTTGGCVYDANLACLGGRMYLFLLCLMNVSSQLVRSALTTTTMRTDVFDTVDTPSFCDSRRFEVVEGASGVIYSHQPYYPASIYRPGRDCFLTIRVPLGYRVELVALEFQVDERYASSSRRCAGDSLHIFDHDKPETLPKRTRNGGGGHQDEHSSSSLSAILSSNNSVASPIKANLCGRIKNNTVIIRSTMNIVTLWWHSEPTAAVASSPHQQHADMRNAERATAPVSTVKRGFRLQWTAFREAAACNEEVEFGCENAGICIPLSLACDNVAHCADKSDLQLRRQRSAGCESVDPDAYSSTSKFTIGSLAGICIGSILLLVLALVLVSVCRKRRRLARRQHHKYNPAPSVIGGGGGHHVVPGQGQGQGGCSVVTTASTNKSSTNSSNSNNSNSDSNNKNHDHHFMNNLSSAAVTNHQTQQQQHHQIVGGYPQYHHQFGQQQQSNGTHNNNLRIPSGAEYHQQKPVYQHRHHHHHHNHYDQQPPIAPPPSVVGAIVTTAAAADENTYSRHLQPAN